MNGNHSPASGETQRVRDDGKVVLALAKLLICVLGRDCRVQRRSLRLCVCLRVLELCRELRDLDVQTLALGVKLLEHSAGGFLLVLNRRNVRLLRSHGVAEQRDSVFVHVVVGLFKLALESLQSHVQLGHVALQEHIVLAHLASDRGDAVHERSLDVLERAQILLCLSKRGVVFPQLLLQIKVGAVGIDEQLQKVLPRLT
eukprot:Amastigsp_a509002_14.p2 type:complete len:200 gc:universal Amastigsp_a509002_14:831-232(-)